MTTQTKEALQKSIVHWEALKACTPGHIPDSSQCALCALFMAQANGEDCTQGEETCPVQLRTGKGLCLGTPYKRVHNLWFGVYGPYALGQGRLNAWHDACQDEIDFLRSLLPHETSITEPMAGSTSQAT